MLAAEPVAWVTAHMPPEGATFDELLRPMLGPAYRFAYAMLGDRQEAEDAVQDAAARAWLHFGRYDTTRPFSNWYLTIVANTCRTRRRSRWWSVLKTDSILPSPIADEEEAIARRSDLVRAIVALPSLERGLLVLRYYYGFSIGEIATILELTPEAAKSRIHRAVRRLRPTLQLEEAD